MIITVTDLIKKYDNPGGVVTINNKNLVPIYSGRVMELNYSRPDLLQKEVVSFGFYCEELTVRIK